MKTRLNALPPREPLTVPLGFGVRRPSGALSATKAAEGCRTPRRCRAFRVQGFGARITSAESLPVGEGRGEGEVDVNSFDGFAKARAGLPHRRLTLGKA